MITSAGQRLGERYVLEARLAVGGMGEVWRGRDEVLDRPVAVKILRLELAPDAAFKQRFRAEARTAAGLNHGGIAAVFDYGEALGSAYLVMELVPGEPLSAMISREGAIGTDRTLLVVSQAARALHAAHRHGVVHRDVKPANLMVTPELRVKITDFGISRPKDHEPLTATGQVMGTAHYLAPELARGEVASPLSDVYALGVVAYECLAGWRPFEGDNQVAVATAHLMEQPPPLPETVPSQLRELVAITMAKSPAERPASAQVLADALEDYRLRRLAATTQLSAGGRVELPERPAPAIDLTARKSERGGQPARGATEQAEGRAPSPSSSSGAPQAARPPAAPAASPAAPGVDSGSAPGGWTGRAPASPGAALPGAGSPSARAGWTGPPTSELPASGTPAAPGGRPRRRRLSAPLIALVLLVLLVLIGAVLAAARSGNGHPSGTGTERTQSGPTTTTASISDSKNVSDQATPSTSSRSGGTSGSGSQTEDGYVTVIADQLVGGTQGDARQWLHSHHLRTRTREVPSTEAKGTVLDVAPTGRVVQGSTVTLTVSAGQGTDKG